MASPRKQSRIEAPVVKRPTARRALNKTKQNVVNAAAGSPVCTPTTSAVLKSIPAAEQQASSASPYPADVLLMAKKRLGLGLPDQLIGRDGEVALVKDSLTHMIVNQRPGSLYLSGPPGTGKTASVKQALRHMKQSSIEFTEVLVNCINVSTAAALHRQLFAAVCPQQKRPAARAMPQAVQRAITDDAQLPIILILDEIDQLETRQHDVLYTAFSWPALPNSRLAVVGIANSLDLTERVLPKLKLKAASAPRLLQFKPYNKDDVIRILKARLIEADSLLDPAAVELCARKISAVTGDIRKALDICKLAIERMQRQKQQQATAANDENRPANTATPPVKRSTVGATDVLRTVQDVFGNKARQATPVLPMQQKLLLCALIAASQTQHNGKTTKALTVPQLFAAYRRACVLAQLAPLEQSECVNQCRLLESHGLVSIGSEGGGGRGRTGGTPARARFGTPVNSALLKVSLSVEPSSARACLDDAVLVSTVLNQLCPA